MDEPKPAEIAVTSAASALPEQPVWKVVFTNWDQYDVPRIWDSLSCVSQPETREQTQNIARSADQLNAQADQLERLRVRLAAAWSAGQSAAAAAAVGQIDALIGALRANAYAAAVTARGVNGVVEAMTSARQQLEPIVNEYFGITSEHHVYAWRPVAGRLNQQAREVMISAEQAIRDHRKSIVLPEPTEAFWTYRETLKPGEKKDVEQPDPRSHWRPPGTPLPSSSTPAPRRDSDLIAEDDDQSPVGGPVLGGMPVPGIPPGGASVLPILPGSPYAPAGGAYVMPTGSSGAAGYVVPMVAGVASGPGSRVGANMPGMLPMPTPMGAPSSNRSGDAGSLYRQGSNTRWDVRQGGPAVIGPITQPAQERAAASSEAEEFRQWYTEVAMPWRLAGEHGEPMPTVTIRRGAQ
ncbi:hypothetical protein [Catellatospora paridis]|uniref:hypothetical protein n=1 Tax=Catellatospora paridis TaxID=1617086 RepID=UPI0012D42579|nr:hypothetical protein [Catellatospora paridis]